MVRNVLFASLALTLAAGLAGCDLYYEGGDSGGDGWNDTSPPDPGPGPGGEPGGTCYNNAECDPGCFCAEDGTCVEAGFCADSTDCADGYVCDERGSCVPADTANGCEANTDCPYGSYCDIMTGQCIGSWTCSGPDQCSPGYECDDRGTCVPSPCTSDDQCLEGCYCDEELGQCIETGTCNPDGTCPGDLECDPDRNTCEVPDEPPPPPPVTCNAEIICDIVKPECPAGQTPAISEGCYTGECILIEDCDVPPPPLTCEEIEDEMACLDRADCKALYAGYDCTTPDGSACEDGDSGCTCERFEFAACQTAE